MWGRLRRLWLRVKARVTLGRWVEVFGPFTVVEPRNVRLGRNVAINHGVFILGRCGVTIEDDVILSANCMLIDAGIDPARSFDQIADRSYAAAPILVREGAWIGAGAIVLAGVTVDRFAIVGAGSVVTGAVAAYTIVAGSPARVIGKVPR